MKRKTPLIVVGFVCGALAIPSIGSSTSTTKTHSTPTATQQTKLFQLAWRDNHRWNRQHRVRKCIRVPNRVYRCRYFYRHGFRYKRCYWRNYGGYRTQCFYRYRHW